MLFLKNRYKGGIIAPGVNLSLETLVEKARLIPNTKLTKIKNIIGKNTQNAVKSGFYWGYQGLNRKYNKSNRKKNKKNLKLFLLEDFLIYIKIQLRKKLKLIKN